MIKSKFLLWMLLAFSTLSICAQNIPRSLPRPKLVVGIVVDQMRWDYLYRYFDRYVDGGFKRLLNDGFTCENTSINYIPAITAVGHSSIFTGSVPAIHGITGNDFVINANGKQVYCTGDSSVQTVGSTSDAGKMSPRNLLVSTITDELKLATNFRSKVIGIALKDRGAILPAGHAANAAYWFDDLTGNWITSSYYMPKLSAWVDAFNSRKLAAQYLKHDWGTLYPIATYVQSAPDNNVYEGKFAFADAPAFPVKTSLAKGFAIIRTTPYGNSLTIDMAMAAIRNEQLGKNSVTDFLTVSLSSTDYVGHQFGPNSVEIEDTYLRLDQDLERLFKFLDAQMGKNNYTLFLTADHGAAHNPQLLTDHQIPAGIMPSEQIIDDLNKMLEAKYGISAIVSRILNYQVYLNQQRITLNKLNETLIREDCVVFLKARQGVAYIIDLKTINPFVPDEIQRRIVNGYNPERSGQIQIILKPGWLLGYGKTGTTHGAWNPYDTHIPLLWMGWGINHGKSNLAYDITDIAPTLSAILHIQVPNGCVGKVINAVIK